MQTIENPVFWISMNEIIINESIKHHPNILKTIDEVFLQYLLDVQAREQ